MGLIAVEELAEEPKRFTEENKELLLDSSFLQGLPAEYKDRFTKPRIHTSVEKDGASTMQIVADYTDPDNKKIIPVTLDSVKVQGLEKTKATLDKMQADPFKRVTLPGLKESIRRAWAERRDIEAEPSPDPVVPASPKGPSLKKKPEREPEPDIPPAPKDPTPAPEESKSKATSLLDNWPTTAGVTAPTPEQRHLFPPKVPPEVLLSVKPNGKKPLVLDHGDRVSVTNRAMAGIGLLARERREAVTGLALQAAKDRFGEPVRFEGTRDFEIATIQAAIKRGIALEPATQRGRQEYERALANRQKQREKMNQLAPAVKQRDKGQGLAL